MILARGVKGAFCFWDQSLIIGLSGLRYPILSASPSLPLLIIANGRHRRMRLCKDLQAMVL